MRGFQARGSVAPTPPPTGQPAFAYRVYIRSEDGDLYALYQGQEKQTAVTYRPETASYKQLKSADKPGKKKKKGKRPSVHTSVLSCFTLVAASRRSCKLRETGVVSDVERM